MYTARLLYKIAGNPGYGQGDILNSRIPQAAIAFGYAYDPAQNYLSSTRSDIVDRSYRSGGGRMLRTADSLAEASTISRPMKWTSSQIPRLVPSV